MDFITRLVSIYLGGRRRAIARYASESRDMQERVLMRLIRRAMDTEWGREHKFRNMNGYRDFVANVPVSS